ncbi:unnamed protein product [Malus baccata var. baccata]
MGDPYEYDQYYKKATCSSSSSPAAQPHSASDDMSLFLQQILVRSSSSLASVVAQPGKAPQFLFSPSPSVGALLPGNLEHPCHSGFFGDEITAIDSSAAFVSAGNPNVSSSSFGASENEADEYDCESEEGLEAFVEAKSGGGRSSSKRSRAAEVHNLSEKTDKASMLDEAIEYLKQLQLQVQMLSMRNGMSLHSLCLPGTLQPVQLSQMRMELGEEIRPLHLDMTNLFNLSNQCTAANESYVPAMSNVVNSETSFGLEPSIQAHLRPFQLPASSQVIYREDLLQHQQINVNHSGMNLSGGSMILQLPFQITRTVCTQDPSVGTATDSLPFNARVSDPKGTFDTRIIGRDRQEGGLLNTIEQYFHIDNCSTKPATSQLHTPCLSKQKQELTNIRMEANSNGPIDSGRVIALPTNPMVTPLLTDLYQFTMAYAYWKAGKHKEQAVFDLYFRKNPFGGEYTIFAGLEECIRFIANFKLTEDDISFVRESLSSSCEDGFYDYLRGVDCSEVKVYAIPEGTVVFPKVPLIRVEGPIAVVQLLETPFLNLVNYASLVATNAARHRFVAGESKNLLEFGLRRAQGPDGGIGASRYCYLGGFHATSNVAAGKLFGIPLRGTHSHAFVSSFMGPDEIIDKSLHRSDGQSTCEDFVILVQTWLSKIQRSKSLNGTFGETNQSELAAFASYALAFPSNFLALVDTYDVMRSGIPNYCAVALALNDLGYKAAGIRLDSGDLAYLSCEARKIFCTIEKEFGVPWFGKTNITASNDLNEETLDALNKQGHEVDSFGIGTYVVTCYAQAALGCVFKLVEINNQPRIKLSEDVTKVSIPCKKRSYRLYGKEGYPLVDIMTGENEPPPKVGERTLCRHPFNESKRAYVVPQRVEELMKCFWPGSPGGVREDLPPLKDIRERCITQLKKMRPDHMRRLNPTPYKVSVSAELYDFIHFLWLNEAPVGELQ